MASGMSLKDSIAIIDGWHERIVVALKYDDDDDIDDLFQKMKWAVEDLEKRFDKYFPPPDTNTEEGRKAEDKITEFLATWGLSIEEMETEDFLASLMYIFNRDLEPDYRLQDFDTQLISPGGVWKAMETLAPVVEKGIPAEEPRKKEPELPKLVPLRLVTCSGCGGKKQFGTNRLPLKKIRGIGRLRRQRQRRERRLAYAV